jgi:hypothetical protein
VEDLNYKTYSVSDESKQCLASFELGANINKSIMQQLSVVQYIKGRDGLLPLIRACLQADPEARPSFLQLVKMVKGFCDGGGRSFVNGKEELKVHVKVVHQEAKQKKSKK